LLQVSFAAYPLMMEVGMTLAHRSIVTPRVAVCAALLVVLASGCHQIESLFGRGRTATQSAILDAQDDYDVGPERPAIAENDPGFPGPTAPDAAAPAVITIATMRLKPGRPRGPSQLLARISSDRDYPPLGVVAGRNIVWRNSWDSTAVAAARWINTLTPAKGGKPDHVLTRDPRLNRYPATIPHQPRLLKLTVRSIGFIVCLDDPACGSGHCGHY
jgi:hypothetical protein